MGTVRNENNHLGFKFLIDLSNFRAIKRHTILVHKKNFNLFLEVSYKFTNPYGILVFLQLQRARKIV
jgi:hypothetical protein